MWFLRGVERENGSGSCEKIVGHSERSEESAFIFLKTNKCRFFASLRMTGLGDFFTRSRNRFSVTGLVTVGSSYDDNPAVSASRLSLMRSA
jgi:hypothetical protein